MSKTNTEKYFIFIPKNITVYKKNSTLLLKSNYGLIMFHLPLNISIHKTLSGFFLSIEKVSLKNKTWVIFFKNLITGISRTFNNRLYLKGIGYKSFLLNKSNLELKLGYSHSINFKLTKGIAANILKNSIIQLNSISNISLGDNISKLRDLKKIDIYKGKGILYKREQLRLKIGKKA